MTKKFLSNAEKEKILKKIATELKSAKKKKTGKSKKFERKSKEVKKLKNEENFNENSNALEFSSTQFSPDIEAKAPILERIALSAPKPIFVGKIPQTSSDFFDKDKEKENSSYVASNRAAYSEKNSEKIYELTSEKTNKMIPERIDISRVGRELLTAIPEEQKNIQFKNFEPKIDSATTERAWTAERFDIEKAGRKNPLRGDEEKYKTYKPKISKGY